MSEAREEAERIVDALHAIWRNGVEQGQVTEQRVVAALAAAITTVEHYTNGSAYMEQVLDEQVDALSALRARAGEEP